jgi:hypothetical protein
MTTITERTNYADSMYDYTKTSETRAMQERQYIKQKLKQGIISTRSEVAPYIQQMPMGEGPSRPDPTYQPVIPTKEFKSVPVSEDNNGVFYCG